MGNPFLLATDFQPTVTWGIVSGVRRYQPPDGTLLEYADCIQTDASINPGNSGGPLFDAQGRLVGINGRCSFEKRGRVNVGVGYAISINQIKNFLGSLRSGRIVDHATLGARVATEDQGRVLVSDVLEQSDAYRRGLRVDDEIISFGGRPITTANGFKNVLGIFPKGWRVPLSYRREGKRYDVLVRLAGVHAQEDLLREGRGQAAADHAPAQAARRPGRAGGKRPTRRRAARRSPQPRLPQPKPGRPLPLPRAASAAGAHAGRRQEGLPGEARLRQLLFQQLEQDRVCKAWRARGDFTGARRGVEARGQARSGSALPPAAGGGGCLLEAPAGDFKWTVGAGHGRLAPPPGSGGLLPALHLWRRLAVEGPKGFGDFYYLGTAPLPRPRKPRGLVDVLVGAFRGVECRFYFDPAYGDLWRWRCIPARTPIPASSGSPSIATWTAASCPGAIEVRVGEQRFGVFKPSGLKMLERPREAPSSQIADNPSKLQCSASRTVRGFASELASIPHVLVEFANLAFGFRSARLVSC